ncbi:MAG: S53 family peptidase, partial [Streptosporangiaceae bacterium]
FRPRAVRAAATMAVSGLVVTAAGFSPATAGAATKPPAQRPAFAFNCLHPPASCYAPGQFRVAYGIEPLLDHGIDGRGETVVVPELATPRGQGSDIRKDLTAFDSTFGLPAARIQVVNSVAHASSPWTAQGEEVEDTEIVHAVAPAATIRVILFSPKATASAPGFASAITTFLRLGLTEGNVLSLSTSLGEHFFTTGEITGINAALQADKAHHVTVIASSGDYGAVSDMNLGETAPVKEVSLPASDPLVLAVGGTSLTANRSSGAYISERAWNTLPELPGGHSSASAGGFSHVFARPSYQTGVAGSEATRGVPDVSGDAAFNTGMALVVEGPGGGILTGATGTSAAAPLWAGLVALAGQFAGHPLGFVNPAIYQIAGSPAYHAAFHDVTTGNNTFKLRKPPTTVPGYQATPGWDPVTGWGSPNAQVLVPLLALYTRH